MKFMFKLMGKIQYLKYTALPSEICLGQLMMGKNLTSKMYN